MVLALVIPARGTVKSDASDEVACHQGSDIHRRVRAVAKSNRENVPSLRSLFRSKLGVHCDGASSCPEEHKGITRMTTAATLLALIAHAQQHVAALESLVAGMTTGLRAGMVDADHMYTLVATQTRAINAQLDEVATTVEKAELRTALSDTGGPPLYGAPMDGIVGKR